MMKTRMRLFLGMAALLLCLTAGSLSASAEGEKKTGWQTEGGYTFYYGSNGRMRTGWRRIGGKLYYFRTEADARGPVGSRMKGLRKIGKYTYYFSQKGILQTGWKTFHGERYFFKRSGNAGELGKMYTGMKKVDGKQYFFNADGKMAVGWVSYRNRRYFFNRGRTSKRGILYTGWHTISKQKYYFDAQGVLQTNCWINGKYYVDEQGRMLKSAITPDGYLVDASGVRGALAEGLVKLDGKTYYYSAGEKQTGFIKVNNKTCYFDENGVRQNGWITVNGKRYYLKKTAVQTGWVEYRGKQYYFASTGEMLTNTVVDGVQLGPDGAALPKSGVSILLIAGHGEGDPGADATYGKTKYYESDFTREFATLIYNRLRATAPRLSITMYDQNYNCFKAVSGSGKGPNPNFRSYDYVLEIHFNATEDALKDPKGDGKCRGVGMYVNGAKKDTAIDRRIVAAVAEAADYPIWGGAPGIFYNSNLLNARKCQELGVSYGLLETAFIDDKDDMSRYNARKSKMAQAVANAIAAYFG